MPAKQVRSGFCANLNCCEKGSVENALADVGKVGCDAQPLKDSTVLISESSSLVGSRLYICGGRGDRGVRLPSMERWDPQLGAWEEISGLPTAPGYGACAAVCNGSLYICGGLDETGNMLRNADCYDPKHSLWKTLPNMSKGRCGAAAASMGGCLYICGGSGLDTIPVKLVEKFNIVNNGTSWELGPPLEHERQYPGVAVLNGIIYLCGGEGKYGKAFESCECLDVQQTYWKEFVSMRCPRSYGQAAIVGEHLYIVGGYDHTEVALCSCERYSVVDRAWTCLPPMSSIRRLAAVGVLEGRLYLLGGRDVNDSALCTGEFFDPLQEKWKRLPDMDIARAGAGCAVVNEADGQHLYVCGGFHERDEEHKATNPSQDLYLPSLAKLDTKTGEWCSLPKMKGGRARAIVFAL